MAEPDLNSPPRPQRIIDLRPQLPSNNTRDSPATKHEADNIALMQFEERLVDQAVSDLPNIASQVFSLNKDHNSEIKRQRDLLASLQEKVKEGEEQVKGVEQEIKCVVNKVYMKEEESTNTRKRIKEIDTDIKSLISKVCNKEQEVTRTKDTADQEVRKFEKKLQEVERYGENVQKFEQSTSHVFSELQKVEKEVAELKKQKMVLNKDPEETERLLSGVIEKELQSETDHLKSQLLQAENEVKLNISKLTEERKKQIQLKQTIQVLHKRNNAQLTRLKHQVKELQTRNRQKQAQLSQLQANMAQAEKQLGQ